MAYVVTLTVEATFDGEYYSRDELVKVMSWWVVRALEDRSDLDDDTVKIIGEVRDTDAPEPFDAGAAIKTLFSRDK
jgi:hypothetical protein